MIPKLEPQRYQVLRTQAGNLKVLQKAIQVSKGTISSNDSPILQPPKHGRVLLQKSNLPYCPVTNNYFVSKFQIPFVL
jgi:hypothetical protein